MLQRLLLTLACLMLMIAFAAPITAQDAASPATFVPQGAMLYAEIQVSAEAEIQKMVQALSALAGSVDSSAQFALVSLDGITSILMPGVSYADDVQPWLGDTVGYALFAGSSSASSRMLIVLPASDEAALAEHREALIAGREESSGAGDVKFYALNFDIQMAVLSNAVLIGTADVLSTALGLNSGEPSLADDAQFQRLWAQLPGDAALKVAVNSENIEQDTTVAADLFAYIIQVAMRFNPATSETEDALAAADWYGGLGAALDLNGNRFEFTTVALANADNPAPELSSETAGAALLDYVPADAVLVFDSYDLSLASIIGGLAVVGPAVNDQFNFIFQTLNTPPDPDKEPPQPPPLPPIDDLYAQFEPQMAQLEMFGTDVETAFETLSGEYAIAILPQEGQSLSEGGLNAISGAAWLQSDDTAGVIDLFDTGLQTLADSASGSPGEVERQVESLSNGGEVITWHKEDVPDFASYGTLSDDVAFITQTESLQSVTDTALGGDSLPESDKFPRDVIESFGTGNEALLYIDMANFGGPLVFPNAADVMDSLAAAFDVREDGVVVLRMTLVFAEA